MYINIHSINTCMGVVNTNLEKMLLLRDETEIGRLLGAAIIVVVLIF